jgi:hypothetical protein
MRNYIDNSSNKVSQINANRREDEVKTESSEDSGSEVKIRNINE